MSWKQIEDIVITLLVLEIGRLCVCVCMCMFVCVNGDSINIHYFLCFKKNVLC